MDARKAFASALATMVAEQQDIINSILAKLSPEDAGTLLAAQKRRQEVIREGNQIINSLVPKSSVQEVNND